MGRRHRVRTDTRHWLTDSLFLFEELFEERNTRRPREVNKVFARGRRVETNKRSMLFLASDAATGARRFRHHHLDAFAPLAAVRRADLQLERVGPAEIGRCVIEGNERGRFDGETLLDIGRSQRSALDGDGAVRRRGRQPDRRQRARRAIGPDISEDSDAHIVSRRHFQLTFGPILCAGGGCDCAQHRDRD